MPRIIMLLIAGCVSISLAACSRRSGAPPSIATPQEAASNALTVLQSLVNEQNYKALGFESADEVKSAALGAPFPIYEIGLDRLKAFQPGQDAGTLLAQTSEVIYPVTVGGQPRSSVTVVKKSDGYTSSSFGNAEVARRLTQLRDNRTGEMFAVHIPVLSLYFLGSRVENHLMLTPVTESSLVPLRVGATVPAEEVLKVVVPVARSYNGLPL